MFDQYEKAKQYANSLRGKFKSYVEANSPKNMGLAQALRNSAKVVDDGLLNPNEYNAPAANRFKDSVFGLLGIVPGVGDAASAAESADLFNRGEYFAGSMAALGALPLVPALGGIIKQSGNLSKTIRLPPGVPKEAVVNGLNKLPDSELWDAAGMVRKDMDLRINPLTTGDYLVRYEPSWGRKGQAFYAVGDNPYELVDFGLGRIGRSEKSVAGLTKAKEEKSTLGRLRAEFGDVFSLGKSTQSKSQYITHDPSGMKIRISDHDLPLHYEQPDLNLHIGMSDEDKFLAIKKLLVGE